MLVYSQYFFKRKDRKIPTSSIMPMCILFCLITMCFLIFVCPVMSGIKVDMPKINSDILELYDEQEYATFLVNDDNLMLLNNIPIELDKLNDVMLMQYPFLKKSGTKNQINIFIRSSKYASYNTIINLMQRLQLDGFENITLVGQPQAQANQTNV
ncbi:MAG: biopolymer transporter ExbD [Rickettsiales bacterium]|nr:biopolymer transporter ExbD [Rickettsiales bacterium]